MKKDLEKPNYLIEISWEVCNLVGGIYTVLSTKASTLYQIWGDHLVFIGPDLWKQDTTATFKEDSELLASWKVKVQMDGLKVRIGRWKVPGNPIAILVDFDSFYDQKNQIFGQMWNDFEVDSLHAYGDYDEAAMFGYAAGKVAQSLYHYWNKETLIVHFNEWTTGMGLLYLKKNEPTIATVFTTHATSIGRSIAGNNKPLYDYLAGYNGDQMARELNMESKHSMEKNAARQADTFTTVSDITARESEQLLERVPLVTPNGFESKFVPQKEKYTLARKQAREALLHVASSLIGYKPAEDSFLIATAGRYEFKNKGIDIFIDALAELRYRSDIKETIAFILVPGWVDSPRNDLQNQLKSNNLANHGLADPIITHVLHNYDHDQIIQKLHAHHFKNDPTDKVKVVFVPSYLTGRDGIFNKSYYELLIGMNVTVFPSYYEPWGYTPLESIAFGVPTITTDLSGFGKWCESLGVGFGIHSGVKVIHRTDSNNSEVIDSIVNTLIELEKCSPVEYLKIKHLAQEISKKAEWHHFIEYYLEAYDSALKKMHERIGN